MTWLYGPLQSGRTQTLGTISPGSTPRLARKDSLVSKKSILKKRSLSEAMLQRSLSNSNLIKRAVDAVVSQRPEKTSRLPLGVRAISDFVGSRSEPSPASTDTSSSTQTYSPASGLETSNEKRRIHFSEKVEQCIAINEDVDETDDSNLNQLNEDETTIINDGDDDDSYSDDGIIMMKAEVGKELKLRSKNSTSRSSFSSDSGNKTIAMLPSTTLKYRGDTPEPPQDKIFRSAIWGGGKKPVRSSSQETLRPSRPSSNFLLEEDDEADMDWQPASPTSLSSVGAGSSKSGMYHPRGSIHGSPVGDEDEEMENRGLRRTPSGMFMPYDEDEDDIVSAGLFGKVVDTVMTAKDIAHVIWNVGWRR